MMFNERKVAQMAAFFLREQEGKMSILKLLKLLYLAERESLSRYGTPMCGDRVVSMDHGPVLSTTLNLINGCAAVLDKGGWEEWISDREEHQVDLKKDATPDALDELSRADTEILKFIWGKFGKLDGWHLRNYTHEHCPEWQDPDGSSIAITSKEIFLALAHSEDESSELAELMDDERAIGRLLQAG